jgi:hypothetical protein
LLTSQERSAEEDQELKKQNTEKKSRLYQKTNLNPQKPFYIAQFLLQDGSTVECLRESGLFDSKNLLLTSEMKTIKIKSSRTQEKKELCLPKIRLGIIPKP